jgi:predicted nucleic acid-binding protein
MTVWADANVLVRFLRGDSPDFAARARRLFRRAAEGEFVLRVSTIVVAEVIWVLGSVYKAAPNAIADGVRSLALADGIAIDDEEIVLDAVRLMDEAKVDFTDAYVAACARSRGERVATFDADFKRLGVEVVS